jgi:PAS domain S-box-containing protein
MGNGQARWTSDFMILSGVLIAIIYWLIDSILNIFFFNQMDFLLQLVGPNRYNISIRLVVLCLFVMFGSHAQYNINARRKAEQELLDYKDSLEEAVRQGTCKLADMNEQLKQEIAERRRMEAAVRESEQKYRLLVENANEAIFIIQDEQLKFSNSKATEIRERLSIDPEVPDLSRYIHPQERERVLGWYARRLEGAELPYSLMFRLQGANEASLWVELNSIQISLNGKPATLNFLRDVTLQKKLEEQFYQSQKMESIGTLAGGIAHDFNNLLMGIQGNISVMNLEIQKDHPLYDSLQSIERCVLSGSKLTSQLLAFARGGKYVVTPTNLNVVVGKTAEIFSRTKKEIDVHLRLAEALWAVDVDPGQVEQVLLNLYVNAWQAMPDGGVLHLQTENIELDAAYAKLKPYHLKPGRFVRVSVTDSGTGMSPETQKRIFEPFFSTKEKGTGTGLGLASAYGIVKNHGGFINCYSELGRGTTFTIYFPVTDKRYGTEEDPGAEAAADGILAGNETILFVDDEEEILRVGVRILDGLGYKVITAADGQKALEIYRERQGAIDLVILDYIMPGMGGREVFDQLRRLDPRVRVLLSSGYGNTDQVADLLQQGCNGFIQKPYDSRQMAAKIREILESVSRT